MPQKKLLRKYLIMFNNSKIKKIHFIGIGGIGMSGMAELLVKSGYTVSGSDIKENDRTKFLSSIGLEIFINHKPENITDSDLIVYSSAVKIENVEIEEAKNRGLPVKPGQWDKIVMSNEFKIIDTRNKFEIDIGSFKNSINPNTDSFREFPKKFKKLKIDKDAKLAMFCTGGIRCEKASSFLKKLGYKNVYQLDGGILSYLNYKNKSKITETTWKGDCFVFDDRVTINSKLKRGEYSQCFGCRSAITNQDIASKYYKKGVYCPKCYSIRTDKQKQRSEMRQKQLELNKK